MSLPANQEWMTIQDSLSYLIRSFQADLDVNEMMVVNWETMGMAPFIRSLRGRLARSVKGVASSQGQKVLHRSCCSNKGFFLK